MGGGSNIRNILRRVFVVLKQNKWFKKLGIDGLLDIFMAHKVDLQGIYGEFPEYKSFRSIIEIELDRWETTSKKQKPQLRKWLKKKNN